MLSHVLVSLSLFWRSSDRSLGTCSLFPSLLPSSSSFVFFSPLLFFSFLPWSSSLCAWCDERDGRRFFLPHTSLWWQMYRGQLGDCLIIHEEVEDALQQRPMLLERVDADATPPSQDSRDAEALLSSKGRVVGESSAVGESDDHPASAGGDDDDDDDDFYEEKVRVAPGKRGRDQLEGSPLLFDAGWHDSRENLFWEDNPFLDGAEGEGKRQRSAAGASAAESNALFGDFVAHEATVPSPPPPPPSLPGNGGIHQTLADMLVALDLPPNAVLVPVAAENSGRDEMVFACGPARLTVLRMGDCVGVAKEERVTTFVGLGVAEQLERLAERSNDDDDAAGGSTGFPFDDGSGSGSDSSSASSEPQQQQQQPVSGADGNGGTGQVVHSAPHAFRQVASSRAQSFKKRERSAEDDDIIFDSKRHEVRFGFRTGMVWKKKKTKTGRERLVTRVARHVVEELARLPAQSEIEAVGNPDIPEPVPARKVIQQLVSPLGHTVQVEMLQLLGDDGSPSGHGFYRKSELDKHRIPCHEIRELRKGAPAAEEGALVQALCDHGMVGGTAPHVHVVPAWAVARYLAGHSNAIDDDGGADLPLTEKLELVQQIQQWPPERQAKLVDSVAALHTLVGPDRAGEVEVDVGTLSPAAWRQVRFFLQQDALPEPSESAQQIGGGGASTAAPASREPQQPPSAGERDPTGVPCSNDCGAYVSYGCEGRCSTCYRVMSGLPPRNPTHEHNGHHVSENDLRDTVESMHGQLNNNVIDIMVHLLTQRGRRPGGVRVLETHTWGDIQLHALERAQAHRQAGTFHGATTLVLPVHVPGHWVLVVVDVAAGEIRLYDSVRGGGVEQAQLANFRSYLDVVFGPKAWRLVRARCGEQQDGVACGVFVIQHMRCVFDGVPTTGANVPATQEEVRELRAQIVREIRNGNVEQRLSFRHQEE